MPARKSTQAVTPGAPGVPANDMALAFEAIACAETSSTNALKSLGVTIRERLRTIYRINDDSAVFEMRDEDELVGTMKADQKALRDEAVHDGMCAWLLHIHACERPVHIHAFERPETWTDAQIAVDAAAKAESKARPEWFTAANTWARKMWMRALRAEGLKTADARGGAANAAKKEEAPAPDAPQQEAPQQETSAPRDIPAPTMATAADLVPAILAMLAPPCADVLKAAERLADEGVKLDADTKKLVTMVKSLHLAMQKVAASK